MILVLFTTAYINTVQSFAKFVCGPIKCNPEQKEICVQRIFELEDKVTEDCESTEDWDKCLANDCRYCFIYLEINIYFNNRLYFYSIYIHYKLLLDSVISFRREQKHGQCQGQIEYRSRIEN